MSASRNRGNNVVRFDPISGLARTAVRRCIGASREALSPGLLIDASLTRAACEWRVVTKSRSHVGTDDVALPARDDRSSDTLVRRIDLLESQLSHKGAFDRDHRLSRLRRQMLSQPSTKWSIRRASEVAGVSEAYFSSFFAAATGLRFSHWLAAWRVIHAARALEEHDLGNIELAEISGFGSSRTLERQFKRFLGVSPGTMRAQFKDVSRIKIGPQTGGRETRFRERACPECGGR